MKKLIFLFCLSFLFACAINFDTNKAKLVSHTAIDLINTENFDGLSKIYTEDFKNSETQEVRELKFKKIIEAIGKIQKIELLDSTNISFNENGKAILKYKLSCSKVNVLGTFVVAEEDGDYKISGINIEQEINP